MVGRAIELTTALLVPDKKTLTCDVRRTAGDWFRL